jgi:hypothetical protein
VLVGLVVASTVVAAPSGGAGLGQRLRWWQDDSWYRARYAPPQPHLTMSAGGDSTVGILVENAGSLTWPHAGADAVLLSYHWQALDAAHPHLDFDGLRTPLPADVPPGGRVEVAGRVRAPSAPGSYLLRWDMVRETVAWFAERGSATGDQQVEVVAGEGPAPAAAARSGRSYSATLEEVLMATPPGPARTELWRAALRLWGRRPLLGVGPDNFRRLYADVIAPAQGGRYDDDRLHANNFYFETLADLGLAGVGALALIMIALARSARARTRGARESARPQMDGGGGASLLALAWVVAAGTFFVHGLLDYFLDFTPTFGLYWLSLALASGGWRAAAASPAPPGSRSSETAP